MKKIHKLALCCLLSLALSGCSKLTEIDMSTVQFGFDGSNGKGYVYIKWEEMEDFGIVQRYQFLMSEISMYKLEGKDPSKLQEEYIALHELITSI